MSLRLKLVIALLALSAGATAAIGAVSYRTTSVQLSAQIDESLEAAVPGLADPRLGRGDLNRGPVLGGFRGAGDTVVQVIGPNGAVRGGRGVTLPIEAIDLELSSAEERREFLRDIEVDGEPYRMLTASVGDGDGALQVARSLEESEAVLAQLRNRILIAALVVASVAALIGWVVARQVTRPLVRLTGAAEQVAQTGQLAVEVPVSGSDETGRLGAAFNAMLAALARSREDQQRLVQDAGHELRTPLTSLRTNIYSLRRSAELDGVQRDRLVDDLESETTELSRLIDEVVELASDRRATEPMEQLALGPLVQRVATRAQQRSDRPVRVQVDDTVVVARPSSLERAVSNLVENAMKFDDTGGPIDVTCERGHLQVSDRGPGFDDADIAHVFDRFYRAVGARSRPGSGLGLAIVADVVREHGGTVQAGNRPGGGAVVGFTLPVATLT